MVACYSLASPPLSYLSTHLYYYFEGSQTLSPLLPHLYYRPRPPSRSVPHSCPRAHSRIRPPSRSRPRPCSRHRFPPPITSGLFFSGYHIIGQALELAPKAAGDLQAQPFVCGDDAARGMAVPGLLLCLFPHVADTKALLLPPFSLLIPVPFHVSHSVPDPTSSPFPVSATALVSVPAPSPFPPGVRSIVSTSVFVPAPSWLLSCPRSLAPTTVPAVCVCVCIY